MNEQIEQSNQEEEEELTCPECGKGFLDMRGLTSHARHFHDLSKEEVANKINENDNGNSWKIIGSIGVGLLALITLGRIK